MIARQGCAPLVLQLVAGQVQRVLVEAGSTIVVMQGVLTIRFPFAWLAENVVARELSVCAEAVHCLEQGGWIDLMAEGGVEAVVLPPDGTGRWAHLTQRLSTLLHRSLPKRLRLQCVARWREKPSGC